MAAGVMFLLYTAKPCSRSPKNSPPAPWVPSFTGPPYLVMSRSKWQITQPDTWFDKYWPRATFSGVA
jgi:hypothetical protein